MRTEMRVDAADLASHDAPLLQALRDACAKVGVGPGDVAILAARSAVLDHYAALLRRSGFGYVHLDKDDGKPSDKVKLGTRLPLPQLLLTSLPVDTPTECPFVPSRR